MIPVEKLFYLDLGVPCPGSTIRLSKLVKIDKKPGHKCMIGIIALLFLNPPLTKIHKLVLHFFTEEDNYCCHCHIHFLVLITNELNLAHDQRSFSYPVSANSGYHTFCIDWRRKGRMDLDITKFRICLTWKTLVPSYTLCSNTVGESPDGEGKNSDDKIPWTSRNPENQLMYTV